MMSESEQADITVMDIPIVERDLSSLDLQWYENIADLEVLYPEWQALVHRVGAEVYLSPSWFAPWWVSFGAGRKAHVLVARCDGKLVGLLPFCVETIWVGLWPMRIARLAGTDPHCMVFRLPIDSAYTTVLLQYAMQHLLGKHRCAAISFTPVSDQAYHLPDLQALGQVPGLRITDLPDGSHVMFTLPDNFETFLATRLSKKRRSQYRRDVAGLEARFGMTTTRSVPDAAAFGRFVTFHAEQWQAAGMGGHFSDWPNSAAFYSAACAGSNSYHGVGFFEQTGRDGPLATQFALLSGQTAHWRLPARSLDPEANHLSVGKVGLVLMIKTLTEAGFRRIEAGRGEYDYKLALGGENVPVHRVLVSRTSALAGLRLRALLAWVNLLDLAYYKIWFKRMSPRLRRITGQRPHPLWRNWIRTRL